MSNTPNTFAYRNKEMMFLCPYCKKADFLIFKEAHTTMGWNMVSQIVCVNCRWVKKNVDLSTPWGPYHPKVPICTDSSVQFNTSQDMTVIPTPPEEMLPECDMPEIQFGVLVPLKTEAQPVGQKIKKPISLDKILADHEPSPPEPQLPEKPVQSLVQSLASVFDKPVKPKKPKGAISLKPKRPPKIAFPGDGSRWDEI
jgi:hypothetical protein